MRNQLHSLVAFCGLLIGVSSARAQIVSGADSTCGYWLGASLGAAAVPPALHGPGALAGTIALDVQRGAWLTSARWHSVGFAIGGDVQSYSVLIGCATPANSFAFSSISLGPPRSGAARAPRGAVCSALRDASSGPQKAESARCSLAPCVGERPADEEFQHRPRPAPPSAPDLVL